VPLLPRYASLLRIGEGPQGDPVTPGYVRWRQTWDLWTLVFVLRGEKLLGGRTGATSWTRLRSGRVLHKKKKKYVEPDGWTTVNQAVNRNVYQRLRGLQNGGRGHEVAVFEQTPANFRRGTLWMLRIWTLPFNSPKKEGIFSPKFPIFERNFLAGQNLRREELLRLPRRTFVTGIIIIIKVYPQTTRQ